MEREDFVTMAVADFESWIREQKSKIPEDRQATAKIQIDAIIGKGHEPYALLKIWYKS